GYAELALWRPASGGDLGLDRAPRAKARVEDAQILQPPERGAVIGKMLGLAADRPIPPQTEPRQIGDDRRLELPPATGVVDILDAQEKPAARRARRLPAGQRRADMTQMQLAGRARRKACDDLKCGRRSHADSIAR